MLVTLLASAAVGQALTLELYRGAELPHSSFRYWSAQDASLDSLRPDGSFGGESSLLGGPGKTVLIKFGDLHRAIGPGRRVKSASLVLTFISAKTPELRTVRRVTSPWGEGPTRTITYFASSKPSAPVWAATWRHRRSGPDPIPWQRPGAVGEGDGAIIGGWESTAQEDRLRIAGLGEAVRAMHERPYENHGFALSFDAATEFESSQAVRGRPRLILELEPAPAPKGPDLSVVSIARGGAATGWPAQGSEVEYTATVKNLGDAEASPFSARWVVRERAGAAFAVPQALKPGETTTVTMKKPFAVDHTDHRLHPIQLMLETRDANRTNDALEVHAGALSVGIFFSEESAQAIRAAHGMAVEDWAQNSLRFLNEVALPGSQFSFAPDGALERVRAQVVRIGEPSAEERGSLDAVWSPRGEPKLADFLHDLSAALGVASLRPTNAGAFAKMPEGLTRMAHDLYPGIMGGGDTRNEALMPPQFPMPYVPVHDPISQGLPMEATDLFAATDVASWNGLLGKRGDRQAWRVLSWPSRVAVRILDTMGNPLPKARVEFLRYPLDGGALGAPVASAEADENGVILLPALPGGSESKPNPFGAVGPEGAILLARTTVNGVSEVSWLKSWHLTDTASRGQTGIAITDLRFNIPAFELDSGNLAKGRIVTDSAGSAPSALQALVDEDPATTANLNGDWIEIDLGRDRPIGEIRLTPAGPFWEQFDVLIYATGEDVAEAKLWTKEQSFRYSALNRSDVAAGVRTLAYRGRAARVRYVRFVRRGGPAEARLAEIRVVPIKFTPDP